MRWRVRKIHPPFPLLKNSLRLDYFPLKADPKPLAIPIDKYHLDMPADRTSNTLIKSSTRKNVIYGRKDVKKKGTKNEQNSKK